jgi:FkbM family methyltransferase
MSKLRTWMIVVRACRNWLPLTFAKLRLWRGLRKVRLRNGLTLYMNDVVRQWGEVFEPAMADVYGIKAEQAKLIVDVGGNIGSFSCLAAHCHPDATIYVFEPREELVRQMEVNLQANRLSNVNVVPKAVTRDGRKVCFTHLAEPGSGNILGVGAGPQSWLDSVTLDVVPFAESSATFIKLDCEGAEGEILDWVVANRGRLPASIRIKGEWHSWCPTPVEVLVQRLREAGFEAGFRERFGETYLWAHSDAGKPDARSSC